MSGRKLASAALNYGMAAYLPRLINFVLLPLYSTKLDPTQLGVLEVMAGVDAFVTAVTRMGLPGAMARAYFDDKSATAVADQVVTTATAISVATAIWSALILVVGPFAAAHWMADVPFHPYVELTLVATALRFVPELQARLLQARQMAQLAARINILLSVVGIGTRVLFVIVLEYGITGALIAELATAVVGCAVALRRHRADLAGRFRVDLLRASLRYGLPLIPHHLGMWAADNASRWILAGLGDLTTVGQLAVASRLASPISAATAAFNTALSPMYLEWRSELSPEEALKNVRDATRGSCALAATVALCMTLGGVIVLRWFLPASYRDASDIVGIVTATLLLRVLYSVVVLELFHMRRTLAVTAIFSTGSLVMITITVPMVKLLGSAGAVWAQFIGIAVSVLISWRFALQTFPRTVTGRSVAVVIGVILIVSGASSLMPGTSIWADFAVGTPIGLLGLAYVGLLSGVRPSQLKALRRQRPKSKRAPDLEE